MASIQKMTSQAIKVSRLSSAVGVSQVKTSSPSPLTFQVISVPTPEVGYYKKPADTLDNHPSSPGPSSSLTSSSELISRLPSKRWEIKSQTVPSNIKVSIADKLQQ